MSAQTHRTRPSAAGGAAREAGDAPGVRSVARAMQLLEFYDEQHTTWTVSELARAAVLPKTTAIRLVATLEACGLLWTRPDGRIAVGARMLRWIRLAETAWQVSPPITDELRLLADRFGETANLYVRQGTGRVCIAQQEGTRSLRHVVQMGAQLPLGAGAASTILLAGASQRLLQQVCERRPSLTVEELSLRIEKAVAEGFAASHGERESGASGIAVPVHSRDGVMLAALALGGPTSRFTDARVAEFAKSLKRSAATITDLDLEGVIPAQSGDS